MNLRDVDTFVVVAGERRFEDAARRLSVSVAQLRESMQRLERAVGAPLVVESADEIRLTSAGDQFLLDTRRLLEELRVTAQDALVKAGGAHPAGIGNRVGHADRTRRTNRGRAAARVGRRGVPAVRMGYGDVEINLAARTVSVGGRLVTLTKKEFQLLSMIALERGEICPRERLMKDIWSRRGEAGQNTLNVHVTTLRAKLGRPHLILTIRGIGYRMATDPDVIEAVPATPAG